MSLGRLPAGSIDVMLERRTPMHETAFLRAIHENDTDDAPRLAFADWLEEHGEASFAKFIRVQCELTRQQGEDDRWLDLKLQEEECWNDLKVRWYECFRDMGMVRRTLDPKNPLSREGVVLTNAEDFQRGFLTSKGISVEWDLFVSESPRWQFLLGIDHLEVWGCLGDNPTFFACPQLWRVRSITCERCGVQNAALTGFADAQHFHQLRRLDFFRNYVGQVGIASLLRCPSLTSLTELLLSENQLGDDGVRTLVESSVCRNLFTLDLFENGITDTGAEAIAHSPHLGRLRTLRLSGNRLSQPIVRVIAESVCLPSLRKLEPDPEEFDTNDE